MAVEDPALHKHHHTADTATSATTNTTATTITSVPATTAPAKDSRMFPRVDTRNPVAVLEAALTRVAGLLDRADVGQVRTAHAWLVEAFSGGNPGFEVLDTPYHDREHTMQGFLCLSRLLAGWQCSAEVPEPDSRSQWPS